jgi:hypothetical protein
VLGPCGYFIFVWLTSDNWIKEIAALGNLFECNSLYVFKADAMKNKRQQR